MLFESGDPSNPASLSAISYLLAALGLSTTAGLRAYLPLLILGIASHIQGPSGAPLIPLQQNFELLGNPLVLAVLAVLALVEFLADKVPGVDHVNDAIHTVIRPITGALIMVGSANSLSDVFPPVAAVVGAGLALSTHTVKASSRAASTATTAGTANPFASLLEDLLVVVTTILLVLAPVIGFIVLVALMLLVWRMLRGLVRLVRRVFGGAKPKGGNGPGAGGSGSPITGTTVTATQAPPPPLPPASNGYGSGYGTPTPAQGYPQDAPTLTYRNPPTVINNQRGSGQP